MLKLRNTFIILALILIVGFLGYQIEIILPATPSLRNTLTPVTQPAPEEVGSYDLLGYKISKNEADELLKTTEGREKLSRENGAVPITDKLLRLGRNNFYSETFGNEVFQTDVVGALNGAINPISLTKAIARLKGNSTTNLKIPLDEDVTIGGKLFPAGTLLNTGLDVPARSPIPLGMSVHINRGKLRVGITCALCHATLDKETGKILEGAPNNDLNTGLILAFATNSAAMFRNTGVNPTRIPAGENTYIDVSNKKFRLPDVKALENAVDAALLTWPPGNFDSTGTMVNNPSQIPSSYTFDAWPYGWSGHSSVGWFHGLTTLNSNVHATNSDATAGADGSLPLLGIDKETYLGILFQNAANPKFRLPKDAKPSEFFNKIDPTPGEPAMNEVIRMPGYPKGSPFMLDGLMASSPRLPVGEQLNGMSAWQNTLAPPPIKVAEIDTLKRGAAVFNRAGCVDCHSGRYFTNHAVIPQNEIGTQPSRAPTLAAFARNFTEAKTYPLSLSVPLPNNPPELSIPIDITPEKAQKLAFAINNAAGGYKVPSLIGLAVTAPYLHDGGVAAGRDAIELNDRGSLTITNPEQLGMTGTLMQGILPDAEASLRVLVDRRLREKAIANNRSNPDLKKANVDGSGHNYWVDKPSGFNRDDQTALIQYLLSLDDNPEVLPQE